MLVKSDSISKLAITSLESKLWSSSENVKESLIVYSVVVRSSSTGTKNFARLYVGVPMADKIGLKDGSPSVTIWLNLAEQYIIPGLKPEGLKSLYCSMEISFLSLRVLRTSVTLFSIWIRWNFVMVYINFSKFWLVIISLFLRRIFNASNSSLVKFFSIVLPVSLYDEKVSLSLLLMKSLSKLETSKESTSLYNSLKGIIKSA